MSAAHVPTASASGQEEPSPKPILAFPRKLAAELLGTFFLVFAIMGVAVNPTAVKDWSGLVIGGTLGFAVMIAAPMTGAGFNPARALGPAIVAHHFDGTGRWLLMYVLAPALGAAVAWFLYTWLMTASGKKGPAGAEPVG
jgi:glycerol uptake facilitator-like aquaporin